MYVCIDVYTYICVCLCAHGAELLCDSEGDAAVTSASCCAWGSIVELTVSAAGWSVNCSASFCSSSSSGSNMSRDAPTATGGCAQPEIYNVWDKKNKIKQQPIRGATTQKCFIANPDEKSNTRSVCLPLLVLTPAICFNGDGWAEVDAQLRVRLLFPQLGINRCVWRRAVRTRAAQ